MIVFSLIYGASAFLAFVGNLFVLLVVTLYRSFHKMRYFLLASLALSDFLFAVLITSNRAVVSAVEEWIFGTTLCHYSAHLVRILHLSTVFQLCAVSYERYNAIVRRPLTYNGCIPKKKAF
ncbi:Chemokine receptor [Desmophyllum pertusum]|uniref:Chemokine receptor n=1 Tax=Desmophyllum pertusum TaxID=174260 RepID=A0A9W9ZF06_9CNID|nr:Chemokine receptor [Desmophyllum pertusum]